MEEHSPNKGLRIVLLVLGIVVAAALFAAGFFAFRCFFSPAAVEQRAKGDFEELPLEPEVTADDTAAEPEPEPEPEIVTIKVSCTGDCTLGTDIKWGTSGVPDYVEANGYDYFFSNVGDIFADDDLTIINFEGTLTESTERADKNFAFRGDPDYVNIVSDYSIEACNLANNHTLDYGPQSYTDTVETLNGAGLLTFGGDSVAYTEINGISVALIGIDAYDDPNGAPALLEADMTAAQDQGAQLIIVTFHWGREYTTVPNDTQMYLGRLAVDLGADLVLGHHPHILQGIENYNDVQIVYSLGNFCFGGNSNPVDYDTMIYQQTFTFVDGELSTDLDARVIPCRISSVNTTNDYCPTPAEGSEHDRILQKVRDLSDSIPAPVS